MALTKVNGEGVGTLSSGLTLTSDDPTITMTDSSGTNDIVTMKATSGALIITARDGSADGEIIFKKTDGSATDETVRINASGRVFVGQTATATPGAGNTTHGTCLQEGGRLFLSADGTYSLGLNRSDSGELTNFHRAGAFKGSISITASAVTYNTSSDYRLKDGIVDMTGAIDRVKALAPKRFHFIEDADTTVDGFLAHEAQAIVPEAVTGTKDAVDGDGNPIYQQIDHSKLVPLLVSALKESVAKIEALEARVKTLEDA